MFKPVNANFVMTKIEGTVSEQRKKTMQWLDLWLTHEIKKGRRGALIFDIDETVIENTNNGEVLIKPVADLYKKYRDMGLPVYFITARPSVRGNKQETEKMLSRMGLGGYRNIYLLSKEFYDQGHMGVHKFKHSKRIEVLNICKDVLVRVGDMAWDSLPPSTTFRNDTSILKKIKNEDSYIIFHPKQNEVSIKLPG